MSKLLSRNTGMDKTKLGWLRGELAIDEEQANENEFAEDYNLDKLNNELDSEIT